MTIAADAIAVIISIMAKLDKTIEYDLKEFSNILLFALVSNKDQPQIQWCFLCDECEK